MKTTLFLNDETAEAKVMLQNATPVKATPRGPEAGVGCNCDRWGHPCPGCVEHTGEFVEELPITKPNKK